MEETFIKCMANAIYTEFIYLELKNPCLIFVNFFRCGVDGVDFLCRIYLSVRQQGTFHWKKFIQLLSENSAKFGYLVSDVYYSRCRVYLVGLVLVDFMQCNQELLRFFPSILLLSYVWDNHFIVASMPALI